MLTVIVPTYNAEPYLSQAIGSLLNEKNIELEILAINDGSTDNSLAIMEDFAARDSRVRVIDKANQVTAQPAIWAFARQRRLDCHPRAR